MSLELGELRGRLAALWRRVAASARAADGPGGRPAAPLASRSSAPATSQAFLARVLTGIPDPALLLDGEQRVLGANAAALALLQAAEGVHIARIDRSPELLGAVERALRTGAPQAFDVRSIVPVERHLTGLATPVAEGERQPGGPALLIVLNDRTEAEQLAQMRADFVANASHELRTPLASLKGFIETMQGAARNDPEARERFLGLMQSQAQRMSQLIDDLLSLSRIEMREHLQPTGVVDLADIARTVAKDLGLLAARSGISLAVKDAASGGSIVTGDRQELMQVLQNLLQNAIKYGRPGGRAEIAISKAGERIAVSIADDGIGIAPEHLPRLTERFYRVSAKDSRERGGTGLGLAIVKHIVNRHRGELRIASTPGAGSTFTVLLPAARPDAHRDL